MKSLSGLKNLKSGSDIRGISLGENADLTNDIVKIISMSFASFLEKNRGIPVESQIVAIGHDSRLSAGRIKDVFINGLVSNGVNVYYCGLSSTPAMSMAPKILSCHASVEITASHHPKEYNGFKFFTPEGGLSANDIDEILNIGMHKYFVKSTSEGTVRSVDLMQKYSNILKSIIKKELGSKKPLEGTKIVVDASNGAGGFFVDVLSELGANTSGSTLIEPDGNFPVHSPNPEKKESTEFLRKITIENNADLGIIFDADVDRCFFADERGNLIIKNRLIALVSKMTLKDHPATAIVTDSVTSDHLKKFIEDNNGYQFREKRGYRNVISSARGLNEDKKRCFLAIETSGHAAFEENDFKDDGAYLAVKIIIETVKLKKEGKRLSDEILDFVDAKEEKEIRIPMNNIDNSLKALSKLKNNYIKIKNCTIDYDTPEGVRLNFNSENRKGWCLLRKSAHDLSLVLNIESDVEGGAKKIFQDISEINIDK